MLRSRLLACLLVLCASGLIGGCGDDAGDDLPARPERADAARRDGGRPGAAGGDACMPKQAEQQELCVNEGEPNSECLATSPTGGPCAPAGPCCQRASNRLKEARLCDDEPAQLEYRVIEQPVRNHPLTAGDPRLIETSLVPYESEPPVFLWRIELPRAADEAVSGAGHIAIGSGRDNCNGTYSFYGETAAPEVMGVSADRARWAARSVVTDVRVEADGAVRVEPSAGAPGAIAGSMFTPYGDEVGSGRAFELVRSGYRILDLDVGGERRDCMGRREGGRWIAGGTIESYLPLADNDREDIALLGQSYCQLISFGVLPMAMRDVSCMQLPRCLPGSDGCRWKKLPDSLCPSDDDERRRFGCHLGAQGNVNDEEGYPETLRCSAGTAVGAGDAEGPCCDPFGAAADMPACNAFRLLQDYVAYAAEISDAAVDGLGERCP